MLPDAPEPPVAAAAVAATAALLNCPRILCMPRTSHQMRLTHHRYNTLYEATVASAPGVSATATAAAAIVVGLVVTAAVAVARVCPLSSFSMAFLL